MTEQKLLRVISIIYIVFGSLIGVIGIASMIYSRTFNSGSDVNEEAQAVYMALGLIFVVVAFIMLVMGILGVRHCSDRKWAWFFIIMGGLMTAVQGYSFFTSINLANFLVFLLPALYLAGGIMLLRNKADETA